MNVLAALQDRLPTILTRRFDYGEDQFFQVLDTLGKHFTNRQQKLIIFLDGLDHAERMETSIRESVLEALPKTLPKGIVWVVGTRELRSWPIFLREQQTNPIVRISMPLFTEPEMRSYLTERHHLVNLPTERIGEIHRKSEELPLYLRYIVEKIRETGNVDLTLSHFPQITAGDIQVYHEELWQEFEHQGGVRYVCNLLACSRFPVPQDDLIEMQHDLKPYEFEDCFRRIQHLPKRRIVNPSKTGYVLLYWRMPTGTHPPGAGLHDN